MTSPLEKAAAPAEAKSPATQAAASEAPRSLYQKHIKIYARPIAGNFNNLRWLLVFLTQALFYGLCWFDWNGRQAVLFDILQRKFYLFGLVFWPQDVIYLAGLLIVSAYALFLFTAIAGRLFCGYACPQTVYTEIFMWIENKIEGERNARMKLDAQAMSARKLRIKATKFLVWGLLAFWTGLTFVGYFTPVKELTHNLVTWNLGPWEGFWMFFYAGFTLMQAGFLREQVCKYMCPYARFQGVMFDPDTLVVTYDEERGEPRGGRRKGTDYKGQGLGDCVDCGVCVQVCPTGIDIRQGLQYECIGCGLCVDGCNQIMDKMNYPRGLIRYSTENAVAAHYNRRQMLGHVLRPRVLLYSSILVIIVAAMVWSIATRIPLKVDVLRDRAVLSREAEDGKIENGYILRIINAAEQPRHFEINVSGIDGAELAGRHVVDMEPAQVAELTVTVQVPAESLRQGSNKLFFDIKALDDSSVAVHEKTTFLMQ
ncbi:cytochrome c oxidase accessory protein CcoG [Oryzomicrobium sp.]|uniref:cytochrome c oxidase accessory protein CcoG n=1 Tax=Oryzomicrobium sp. TaxID=1911578 RepID=UPI0025ED3C26|nr:cytochrome c oxidase accessory protein CcoG [Oryzomicrobium sp.]MCE1241788.1 cytochrome c oxidase accessory protein CcoG [Oryzomicrobium sp.]